MYEVESADGQRLLIKRASQNVEHRMEAPHAPNKYILTTSNQTLELHQQTQSQTIQTNGLSWKTVSQPWTHRILTRDEEKNILTPQQRAEKVCNGLTW